MYVLRKLYHMEIYGSLRGLCVLICHPELSENGGHSWVKKMFVLHKHYVWHKKFPNRRFIGDGEGFIALSIGIESIKADPMTEIFFGSRKLHETYMVIIF